ncbi:MAG TPA: adenylate/guanylate cyclase domain-containing protein [Mycobacteriales bacterium]|nr:adenylate/guanylate cyclase domain-containing protein [Mycobacteriales bacterium]
MSSWDETRYATDGGPAIAYRTRGTGPRDIVFVSNWFTNVEVLWEHPIVRPFFDQLASLGRLIVFDQPGTGASDPISLDALPTLEQWSDSVRLVLDAASSDQAVVLVQDGAFPTGALFAATHPTRTTALVVTGGWARMVQDVDYPQGLPLDQVLRRVERSIALWGTGELQGKLNPDMPWNEEVRSSIASAERLAVTPRMARQMFGLLAELDVREILPSIRVPTLVLHHDQDRVCPPALGRYIAENIPGATYVEIPGRNHYLFVDPWREPFAEILAFVTGTRGEPLQEDRVLATVLFTDIVESTRRAAEVGDRNWHALLDAHDAIVRSQLARYRGHEVKTVGDGFLATFDGPQRAIRCALAIRESLAPLGVSVRAGLHTGECEVRGDDVGGLAVHIGARVASLAAPDEVLVSSTLKDLVIGSGITFEERGSHALKGVPGEWRLFSVQA